MVPRNFFIAIICTTLLTWSGLASADQYRPDEFLSLDLSKAVLSPKPLGPPSGFTPGPLDVNVDRGSADTQASTEPKAEPTIAEPKVEPTITVHKTRVVRAEKPRVPVRTRLARRHTSPLDAQAFDTRIQVWPCKSGGICNWKR
jgi:hypothetical protein